MMYDFLFASNDSQDDDTQDSSEIDEETACLLYSQIHYAEDAIPQTAAPSNNLTPTHDNEINAKNNLAKYTSNDEVLDSSINAALLLRESPAPQKDAILVGESPARESPAPQKTIINISDDSSQKSLKEDVPIKKKKKRLLKTDKGKLESMLVKEKKPRVIVVLDDDDDSDLESRSKAVVKKKKTVEVEKQKEKKKKRTVEESTTKEKKKKKKEEMNEEDSEKKKKKKADVTNEKDSEKKKKKKKAEDTDEKDSEKKKKKKKAEDTDEKDSEKKKKKKKAEDTDEKDSEKKKKKKKVEDTNEKDSEKKKKKKKAEDTDEKDSEKKKKKKVKVCDMIVTDSTSKRKEVKVESRKRKGDTDTNGIKSKKKYVPSSDSDNCLLLSSDSSSESDCGNVTFNSVDLKLNLDQQQSESPTVTPVKNVLTAIKDSLLTGNEGLATPIVTPNVTPIGRYYSPQAAGRRPYCTMCKVVHLSASECKMRPRTCHWCGETSHKRNDCPEVTCKMCRVPGHPRSLCLMHEHVRRQKCRRCRMLGHVEQECPDLWRQFHVTTEGDVPVKLPNSNKRNSRRFCSNCASNKHFNYDCTRKPMIYWNMASFPRVVQYDTEQDMKEICEEAKSSKELETTKLINSGDSSVRGDGGGRGCEVRADSTYTIPEHKACKNCWHSKAQSGDKKSKHKLLDKWGRQQQKQQQKQQQQQSTGKVRWKPKMPHNIQLPRGMVSKQQAYGVKKPIKANRAVEQSMNLANVINGEDNKKKKRKKKRKQQV